MKTASQSIAEARAQLQPDQAESNSQCVVVCVTGQRNCDRLITAGRSLADKLDASLTVMSAMPPMQSHESGEVLEYLFGCSRDADAEMLVLYTDKPLEMLVVQLRNRHIMHVVLGAPNRNSSQMGALLMSRYPEAKYYICDEWGHLHVVLPQGERAL